MKQLLENIKVAIAVGVLGLALVILGLVKRAGAYDQADWQEQRVGMAIAELEAFQVAAFRGLAKAESDIDALNLLLQENPEEQALLERVEFLQGCLNRDLKSAALRSGRAMNWIWAGAVFGVFGIFQCVRLGKSGKAPSAAPAAHRAISLIEAARTREPEAEGSSEGEKLEKPVLRETKSPPAATPIPGAGPIGMPATPALATSPLKSQQIPVMGILAVTGVLGVLGFMLIGSGKDPVAEVNPNLKHDTRGGAVTITDCEVVASGDLVIPAQIEGNPVKSIGDDAFSGCNLTSITIPNTVTTIGRRAFAYTRLTSITIPSGITSIRERAFYKCSNLTSITIPDSVTSIGERAFAKCSSLTSITIPDSVTSIGTFAFRESFSLNEVTFLGDVPKVAENAFEELPGVTSKATPTIYRKPEAKGWGDTFAGRPVKLISEKP